MTRLGAGTGCFWQLHRGYYTIVLTRTVWRNVCQPVEMSS
jgi:hypothetical protein